MIQKFDIEDFCQQLPSIYDSVCGDIDQNNICWNMLPNGTKKSLDLLIVGTLGQQITSALPRADSKYQQVFTAGCRLAIASSAVMS